MTQEEDKNKKQRQENIEKYDELFNEKNKQDSVFKDKSQLDPLKQPDKITSREKQEKQLANILNSIHEGYLPPTVSIYGPPGTGKTITTRKLCNEFTDRNENVESVYVNLKESRSLFSAANEIHLELTGQKKKKTPRTRRNIQKHMEHSRRISRIYNTHLRRNRPNKTRQKL